MSDPFHGKKTRTPNLYHSLNILVLAFLNCPWSSHIFSSYFFILFLFCFQQFQDVCEHVSGSSWWNVFPSLKKCLLFSNVSALKYFFNKANFKIGLLFYKWLYYVQRLGPSVKVQMEFILYWWTMSWIKD